MKAPEALDLQDSLVPASFIFDKLKSLIQDEQLKSVDLLSLIKIDPCLMLEFLNVPSLMNPKAQKRATSLEEASAKLPMADLLKFIQLELLKAQGFPYSHDFYKNYLPLWESALFCASFLETAAPFVKAEPNFAYSVGLLHAIDSIAECSLLHLGQKHPHEAKLKEPSILLKSLNIPEALLAVLLQQKDAQPGEKSPLASCLDLAIKLKEGQNVEKLESNLGFGLDLLPSLCKKTQKRLSDIYRFIAIF